MKALRRIAVIGLFLALAACGAPPGPPRLDLERLSFGDLEGWRDDAQGAALTAFVRSCDKMSSAAEDRPLGRSGGVGGLIADWRGPCAAAVAVPAADDGAARQFFEAYFTPFRMTDQGDSEGLFTGYYEPLLNGAAAPGGRFTVPIHGLPPDLVSVDLGLFSDDLGSRKIIGRVVGGALLPYPRRGEIAAGALRGKAPVLAWVDDPVDAFFLHVQGSGRIGLDGGGVMRVGYAGANGRAYVSIGRALIDNGAIRREDVTLQSIRAWLAANPGQAADILALNPSYVFFRELVGDGPLGAQGVALTPGRSLAVDRRFLPLGAPIWLDIMAPSAVPDAPDRVLRRLVIAQDTGGAIKGPLRGDLFWGFGPEAESIAGRMKHPGGYVLLLPKALAETLS
ncbi:MAG: murein transglycosylase A [Proteobacteria bacterium]|nr:murein transglycosylase A [Pseudomonadota bacterium]